MCIRSTDSLTIFNDLTADAHKSAGKVLAMDGNIAYTRFTYNFMQYQISAFRHFTFQHDITQRTKYFNTQI